MTQKRRFNPLAFFILTFSCSLILEAGNMLLLPYLHLPRAGMIFADSVLLAIFLSVILYRFTVTPLVGADHNLGKREDELALNIRQEKDHLMLWAPDPMVTLSTDGRITSVNNAVPKYSGYTSNDLIGKHFAEAGVLAGPFLTKAIAEFTKVLTGGISMPFETEITHKNGRSLSFEIHEQLIQSTEDKGKEVLVILRDISERKKMDAALRLSEQRYRVLTESAQASIFLVDREEKLLFINQFGAKLFKASADELIGKTMREMFPESYEAVHENFQTILKTKAPSSTEEEIIFPTRKMYVDTQIIPMFDEKGEIYGFTGIARDVTERKNREALIRLQAQALEAASNGIVITDTHGIIQWVNAAFTKMTGYTAAEAIGKNPRILKSGEQPAKIYEALWTAILSGKTWSGELINRRKDGSLYFEKQIITPVRNEKEVITHFVAVKEDVSSGKKLETQLRQAQKMEAIGRLAGGVAHDFNNLLTVILGRAEMMLMNPNTQNPVRDSIEEIKIAGQRAAALTRQLLAFSRKQIFQIKVMSLNDIVGGIDKMLRRLVRGDVEIVTILGENLKPIQVDPAQIDQVLMNLAINASDAMPQGGKLIIETSLVQVDAKTADRYPGFIPGEYIRLHVKDTGGGISDKDKAHIFEPFFTTKEQGKGTGLGLATIYGIVKQSKGFIYMESELGKGTSFTVYLPPAEQHASEANIPDVPVFPKRSDTILIAEDEELVRALAGQILTTQGFHIMEASNGLDAMRIAEKNSGSPPQILFTDMVMPFMGGNELAEKFSAAYPKTKIIFTSGYTDHNAVQKWLDQGCRFLQKPYTHAELLTIINETLVDKK